MAAGIGDHDESPVRIGSTVSCVTCFDEKIQGEVICYDHTSKLLAIKTVYANNKGKCDVTLVNLSFVKSVDILKGPQHPQKDPKELPALNLAKLKKREEENTKERKLRLEKGIPEEGAKLYTTINKTLKSSWQDKSIFVENVHVLIDPPYKVENCRIAGSKDNSNMQNVEYIKKLVRKFYQDQENGA